ncbi:MAG TPA: circadian clock KaiB family protein [Methanotrichaceae archaeon]|nr:circadian clock KaiB family protein [Methanotrichaceae archaeon]
MSTQTEVISMRLYIAAGTPNSILAVSNLQAIVDEHLAGRHSLEVIDVLKEPSRAIADGVLITPMLVKLSPPPKVSVIGNLGDKVKVLCALDLGSALK